MTKPSGTQYRTFDLPGYGRVSAPAQLSEEELLAAMQADDADDPVNTPKTKR